MFHDRPATGVLTQARVGTLWTIGDPAGRVRRLFCSEGETFAVDAEGYAKKVQADLRSTRDAWPLTLEEREAVLTLTGGCDLRLCG